MATSNVGGSNPKGVKNKYAAKPGGFTPPSAGQHPPGKAKVGGIHSPGKVTNHGGGRNAGSSYVHPSLKKAG